VRDLAPTLLELAGVRNPGSQYQGHAVTPMSGVSLMPLLRRQVSEVHTDAEVFAGETSGEAYVRHGRWKAVLETPFEINFNETADASGVPRISLAHVAPLGWRLYDIERDRGETTDVAAREPTIIDGLVREYENYAARVGVITP